MFISVHFSRVFILWTSCSRCFKNKTCSTYVRITAMFRKINIYIRYIWKHGGPVTLFPHWYLIISLTVWCGINYFNNSLFFSYLPTIFVVCRLFNGFIHIISSDKNTITQSSIKKLWCNQTKGILVYCYFMSKMLNENYP